MEGTIAELAPLEVPLEELGHQLVSVRHTGKIVGSFCCDLVAFCSLHSV